MTDTSRYRYESGNLCCQVNIVVTIKQVVLIALIVAAPDFSGLVLAGANGVVRRLGALLFTRQSKLPAHYGAENLLKLIMCAAACSNQVCRIDGEQALRHRVG